MAVGSSGATMVVGFLAIVIGIFVSSNKLLFGLNTGEIQQPELYTNFIQPKDDVLDYYLEKHQKQIGSDFVPYKNHCLRVMAFTRYFLKHDHNIDLDDDPTLHNIVAMALAYHDIALWTDHKLDYLEPSANQMHSRATEEIKQSQQVLGTENDEMGTGYVPSNMHWSTFEEDSHLAQAIILQHHKFTTYKHVNATKLQHFDDVVNAVRKSDWADATVGLIRFGLPQSFLGEAYKTIPEAGFHNVLLNMAPKLSPDSVVGQMEVLKILKW